MDVSMNIMLDSMRRYCCETHIGAPGRVSVRRVAPLPREPGGGVTREGCLYVGRLSDAMRVQRTEGFVCFCLRDRERDTRETEETLSGLLIVDGGIDLEGLFAHVQDAFSQVSEWREAMLNSIITKKPMQDIIGMSEPVIGNFISVSDSALSLIAYTKNISTDDPISLFLIENGYHSEDAFKKFKRYNRFETWTSANGLIVNTDRSIAKHDVISKVYTFGETYFTHVVMSCNVREVTPGLLDLFKYLTDALGHYITREWEEEKDFSHVYNSLVAELMGGAPDRAGIRERARIVGIRADDKFVVMLPAKGDGGSAFPERMARDLGRMFRHVRSVYYSARIMLFLHHPDIDSVFYDMLPILDQYFRDNNVRCGISDVFSDLLELPDAYHQAELALSEGGATARGKSGAALFDTYFARCLLDNSQRARRLFETSRYGKLLTELRKTDAERHTTNFEVLRTYLWHERRATDTASELHMHRNNVVYRVGRIEELLGIDLEDWRVRRNLLTSFLVLGSE
ncbi:MAG: helix-turn-helix domain-containing protein [Oscillospiraceae bacterium]|jgi:hypothetical protein|nr:helix-turn-helix domain-containing protein [Oscillospiraceae bacterium]